MCRELRNESLLDDIYARKDDCWEYVYNNAAVQCSSVRLCDHVYDQFSLNFISYNPNWIVLE